MAEVIWSDNALRDIEQIAAYIERDSLVYANRMVHSFFEHSKILELFPKAGRKVPEHNTATYREIPVSPYRVIYKLVGKNVEILTVIHSRRKADKILRKL